MGLKINQLNLLAYCFKKQIKKENVSEFSVNILDLKIFRQTKKRNFFFR
jgi:hypothetical protein